MIKTNIQVVVFLFNTFKSTSFVQSLLPQTSSKIRNNSNITMLALMLSFAYKIFQRAYKQMRKKAVSTFEHLPKDQWKNDYPIVLVHGFGGWVPDESFFFGDYFGYASYSDVQGQNRIYQADIAPWGSLHDRACELYQQLIGIFQTQRAANRKGITLAEQVYGKQHFDEEHREQFYKPRYLRRIIDSKVLAYPNGIPEGWSRTQKIHFVGHSQGGQTVRYLQYLLKIDYFNDDGKSPKIDKSDWIASLTGINPILNGGIATYMFDFNLEKEKFVGPKEGGRLRDLWFIEGCKIFTILHNLVQSNATLNVKREKIKNIIKQGEDECEVIYEMVKQPYFFFDFNQETIGHNRRKGEKILDYVKRVLKSDVLYDVGDYALHEFCPVHMKDINEKINSAMSNETYYFSYAAGIKNKNKMKARETFQEPKQLSKMGMGFDIDIDQNLKFTEQSDKIPRRPKNSPGFIERIIIMLKVLGNVVSINNKVFYENLTILRCPADYLNNILNPNMNSSQSLDFANKDLTNDSDLILPRWTQEYPKFASNYKDKLSINKPWGQKSEPIYFDNEIDSIIQTNNFEKGIWYYSSVKMSDHHDLAGFPNKLWFLLTILGREFRPQTYINIFNRIRSLEFVECQYLRKNLEFLEQ